MKLYLVRHGKAEAGVDDHARCLTDRGQMAVEKVARRMAKANIRVDRIEHSGLVRAAQTADILAASIGGKTSQAPDLAPLHDIMSAVHRLSASAQEPVMLVGHQPYMGRLASYLLVQEADASLLHFETGCVACLCNDDGQWTLRWLLTPAIA